MATEMENHILSIPEKKKSSGTFSWFRKKGSRGELKDNITPSSASPPHPHPSSETSPRKPDFQEKANWRKSSSHVFDVFRKQKTTNPVTSSSMVTIPISNAAGDLVTSSSATSVRFCDTPITTKSVNLQNGNGVPKTSETNGLSSTSSLSLAQPLPSPSSASSSPALPPQPLTPTLTPTPAMGEGKTTDVSSSQTQTQRRESDNATPPIVSAVPLKDGQPVLDPVEDGTILLHSSSRGSIQDSSSSKSTKKRKHRKKSSRTKKEGEEGSSLIRSSSSAAVESTSSISFTPLASPSSKPSKGNKKKEAEEREGGSGLQTPKETQTTGSESELNKKKKKKKKRKEGGNSSSRTRREEKKEHKEETEQKADLTPRMSGEDISTKIVTVTSISPTSSIPTTAAEPLLPSPSSLSNTKDVLEEPTTPKTPKTTETVLIIEPSLPNVTTTTTGKSETGDTSIPVLKKGMSEPSNRLSSHSLKGLEASPLVASAPHLKESPPNSSSPTLSRVESVYRPNIAKHAENRKSLRMNILGLFGGGSKIRLTELLDGEDHSKATYDRRSLRLTDHHSTVSPLNHSGSLGSGKSGTEEEKQGSTIHKKRSGSALRGSTLQKKEDSGAPASPAPVENEIIVANCYDELPKEIQRKIVAAKIDVTMFENQLYWKTMCNIIHFRLKKRIVPTEVEKPAKKVKDNFRQLDMTIEEAEIFYFTAEDPKKNPKKVYKNFLDCGKGGYGRVFSATSTLDKEKVAIKKMPHITEKDKRHNLSEIRFLHLIEHPNICKYIRTHWLKDEVWIVMEYMQGGTLNEAVKQHDFSEGEIAFVAREVLHGLVFLHKKNWVHRDLKSSNIMLTTGGDIKLIDFGLCIDVSQGGSTHMCGSPYWMSPEMIRKEIHGAVADIWSLGISLLELANKHPPHHKNALLALFTAATVGYPQPFERAGWGDELKHFMANCLTLDPAQRPDSEKMIRHAFLLQAVDKKVMEHLFSRIFLTNSIMARGF